MRLTFLLPALAAASLANADIMEVTGFDYYGPFPVSAPLLVDSLDVNSKTFALSSLLDQPLERKAVAPSGKRVSGPSIPNHSSKALHMLALSLIHI